MTKPRQPLVGITVDLNAKKNPPRAECSLAYVSAVADAGGTPILLPPRPDHINRHLDLCDAFVFTGGDDPRTEPFGVPTHPSATPMVALRQEYETALLRFATDHPDRPTLGVCLGMQLMGLVAGGVLNQHLPDTNSGAARHVDADHRIEPLSKAHEGVGGRLMVAGEVRSRHNQAIEDPGELKAVALADDGVIEAIADPNRRFYLGVQWHPERTADPRLGTALFKALIEAAAR